MSSTTKILALLATLLLSSKSILAQSPHSRADTGQQTSASYLDFSSRLRASVKDNSIALLMVADSLRNGEATSEKIVAILTDHKNRISGLDSFRAGRHTITIKSGASGEISTSGLIEKFAGAGVSVGAGFDFEIVRQGRDLIPISGREQAQTGYDYVIGDARIEPKACGSLTGGIKVPAARLADASLQATSALCYEYSPSSMTALGGYIAQNQERLVRLEKLGGEDLAYLTDRLYAFYSGACDATECAAIAAHLADLNDAGLGLDLPTTVRSNDQIRADLMTDPSILVLLDDNATTREQVAALEQSVDRQFSDVEKALIALSATDGEILAGMTEVQREQLRQGELLNYLADPEVQAQVMVNAMATAEVRLRQQKAAMDRFLLESFYSDLPEPEKRAKFVLELRKIDSDYQEVNTYAFAAQNTLLLIGALTGASAETQRDVQRAFAVINAANELVKAGRTIQNAVNAGMLTSGAAVGAYAGGVGAALTLVSIFSGGGESELEGLARYLGARLDVIDDKLNLLIDQSIALHQKVDALLEGQRIIIDIVFENARAIQAGRIELAAIAESIDSVKREIRALDLSVDEGFTIATRERSVYFDAELRRDQEQALTTGQVDLSTWLSSDSDTIQRLNAGDRSAQLMDAVRGGRQKVLDLIERLSGPTFVRPLSVVSLHSNDVDRPPVHGLAALPDRAEAASAQTGYYREFRKPELRYPLRSSDDYDHANEQLTVMQQAAFPVINAAAFAELPNPDALLPILERYLTFVLALNPEAREAIGFSDLQRIADMIERLSASKREAQAATFALFAASRSTLRWMSRGLENLSTQRGLFARQNVLGDYIFRPNSLVAENFVDDAEADSFTLHASANGVALDWLAAHVRPYVERGLRGDPAGVTSLVAHIKETGNWRLPKGHQAFTRLHNSGDTRWWNLRLLSHVRAALNAYEAGELFEYNDAEITELDQILVKPVLAITDHDIASLINMMRSPASLIRFAEDEGLIQHSVTASVTAKDAPFDLDPMTPELASVYATVAHVVYHSGSLYWSDGGGPIFGSDASLSYSCKGAEIRITPGKEESYRGPASFAFPTDAGVDGAWGDMLALAANAVVDCDAVARKRGMTVPHPRPYEDFTGSDYWAIVADPHSSRETFKRDTAIVADGTKLFEHATTRCVLQAEWRVNFAGTSDVDVARPVATLAKYVERTLDSPFVYESKKVVDAEIARLFADDGQPLNPRQGECMLWGESASFSVTPELPQLGKSRPADLVDSRWHFEPAGAITLAPQFRAGVISALQSRRAEVDTQVLKEAGEAFREPADGLDLVLTVMRLAGVSREEVAELVNAYRAGGRQALLGDPLFEQFRQTHPRQADEALRSDQFYMQRQNHVALLQTFAEWGLGECLFTVPEYQVLAMLFWEPLGTARLTLPGAIRTLQDPNSSSQYPYAAAAIKEGQSRLEARLAEFVGFPPTPQLEDGVYARDVDIPIDTVAAIAIAQDAGCRPGHDTIMALENLLKLMRDHGLVAPALAER